MDPNNSRIFECPCCQAKLKIQMTTQITGVEQYRAAPTPPRHELQQVERDATRTPDEIKILQMARAGGLIHAFDKALEVAHEATGAGKPKDTESFFIHFLRLAKPRKVPQFAMQKCAREYGGVLQFYGSQNILSCVSDGRIVAFFPLHMIVGAPITSAVNRNFKGRVNADEEVLEQWIRTKYGYVGGRGVYMEQLRKRSFGEFANPIL